jgi:hypothetical protein
MKRSAVFLGFLAGIGICTLAVQPAAAASFTFATLLAVCGGAELGAACAAEAAITTGTGSISVTITYTMVTPGGILNAGQALSDLSFTLSNAPGTQGTLTASGQLANIGAGGTVTDVSGSPVRWIGQGPSPPGGSGTFTVSGNTISMQAIGGDQPSQMILPSGGSFTHAKASITNGMFSPFVIGQASFTLDFAGVTPATTVTSATFSFGTGPDTFVPGFPNASVHADETLCSQANPTPPPCIPSAIATPLNGHILRSFDISYVDPTIHTYVLAASGTVGAGNGPSSNPRIIVVDTITNKVVHQYNATPTFAGNCPALLSGASISGPNGVILIAGSKKGKIEGSKKGKKVNGEIWAGDGPVYTNCTGVLKQPSSVKVLDLATGKTLQVISTRGAGRADELCFNPFANVVLVANPESIDNFITFIDGDSHQVRQQIKFDGTDPNSAPPEGSNITANGIEQCQYNPRDGKFYLAIPRTLVGSPPTTGPGVVVRISAIPPFHVEAAFTIPIATGCVGPNGLAIGPSPQIALGCGGANSLIINETSGSPIATVTGEGGADEIWYNHGTNHYYFARSTAGALGVEDAGPPAQQESPPEIAIATGSHSVAADAIKHEVYVPIRSNLFGPATVCSSFSGDPTDDVTGCIAVYLDVGEVPPGAP